LRIDNLSAGIGNPALLQGLLITRFDRRRERRSARPQRLSAIIGTLSGLRRNPVRNASDSAYLTIGAVGILGSMNRIAFVTDRFEGGDIIAPLLLTTAVVIRFMKTRAEIGEWNK
jgi:hypothetical protein